MLSSLPAQGEIFDGKYLMGSVLGVGGMAAVVGARHLGLDELVAIKVLLPEFCNDPAIVERFVQEGKTATKIRSEHVVRMLDVGVASGHPYLVMEYLDGEDLDALLRKGNPLPFGTAVDLLLQACEAIGEAHALGIVHRDLKPANLFLTHRPDGSTCVKVLDFGISKMQRGVSGVSRAAVPATLPSIVMGSPHYMSPEQMRSAAMADERSDVWSLGVTLYELLTGQRAFDGASTAEVCARAFQGAPVPVTRLRPDVPYDVELVISRCLQKEPSQRFANVAELARALAPFGSSSARVSAESIARVVEGGIEGRPLPGGTMRPTAAEILAAPSPPRRRSGYFVGTMLLAAALAVLVTGAARRVAPLHWSGVVAAAAAPPAIPTQALPPPAPSATVAPPAPIATRAPPPVVTAAPAKPRHAPAHRAVHAPPAAMANPYDAPF